MNLPPLMKDRGISQDMVATLRDIAEFRSGGTPAGSHQPRSVTAATEAGSTPTQKASATASRTVNPDHARA